MAARAVASAQNPLAAHDRLTKSTEAKS